MENNILCVCDELVDCLVKHGAVDIIINNNSRGAPIPCENTPMHEIITTLLPVRKFLRFEGSNLGKVVCV